MVRPMGNRLLSFCLLATLLVLTACDSSGPGSHSALPNPVLVSPISSEKTADAVLLDWADVSGALRYRVQLADAPTFSSPLVDQMVTTRSKLVAQDLEQNVPYFWRVMAMSDSKESDWSQVQTFTPSRIALAPDKPDLSLPINGTVDLERSIRLEWDAVEDAISYHLVVTIDEEMLLYQADLEQIEEVFFELEGLIFTYPYWWKVRALGPAGYSDWSPVWIFQVKDGF